MNSDQSFMEHSKLVQSLVSLICTIPVGKEGYVMYSASFAWYRFMLLGAGAMTLSLNLDDYVKHTDSPIYVDSLAQFAKPVSWLASLYHA